MQAARRLLHSPVTRPRSRAAATATAAPARFLLFLLVWLSLFAYAGRPLLVSAAAVGVPPVAAWTILFALAALPLVPLIARDRARPLLQWSAWMIAALFAVLLGLVFIGDLVRLAVLALDFAGHSWPVPDSRHIGVTTLAAGIALSLIGFVQARCPRVRRVRVVIDGLREDLEGYRIVQWSDVHVGPTIQRGFVQTLVDRTNQLNAGAIAITGDLGDGSAEHLAQHLEPIRELRANDGIFYVTGNHEYYWGADAWIDALERVGVTALTNAHVAVRPGLAFAGVTDPAGRGTHRPDLRAALAGIPRESVTVLLSHRPQTAQAASKAGVALQLSGHTHGGQFFPFNLFIRWFQPIVAGLHRVGATHVYVNRGTGYWGPPSRLGVGGEITVLELTGG
jgi:predicted MPP superfamily phosphohydrolase